MFTLGEDPKYRVKLGVDPVCLLAGECSVPSRNELWAMLGTLRVC